MEFSTLKDQWQDVLNRSDADRLFLSWHWMSSWWETYGKLNNDSLLLLGVYDDSNTLVCLAPFYLSTKKIKNIYPVKIVQFLGTRVGGSGSFRTEYLQCIADSKASENCIKEVFNYLIQKIDFDELWLNDLIVDSVTYLESLKFADTKKIYKRIQSESQSYGINVETSFINYVETLGKNTRLKVYNRRKVLNSLGKVTIEPVDSHNFQNILSKLTDFHLHRWDEDISYVRHSEFISKLIAYSAIQVCGIIIRLDNEIIGCTFDLVLGERSYNIQSGYKDGVDKKIAMGSLTIGYAIEYYCDKPELKYYDFLAGEGKKSNYKVRIAKLELKIKTMQFVSSPMRRYLYKIKDKLDLLKAR